MLRFVRTMPKSVAAQMVEGWLSECFSNTEGVCYYKHPAVVTKAVATNTDEIPDFILFTKTDQPLVVRIVESQLSEIRTIEEDIWGINDTTVDSPLLVLEDLVVKLENKFRDQRKLRSHLHTHAVLVLPFIAKGDFEARFGALGGNIRIIWKGGDTSALQYPLDPELSNEEWTITRSVIQGSTHLHKPLGTAPLNRETLGNAIKSLERRIEALDDEQEKVVLEIAPGPQRIRGLAGTGKTLLLAMKAAYIHMLCPEKKILFTFNTWRIYSQVKGLISKTYHEHKGADPDWNFLHVRHACGGPSRSGVYLDLCARQGIMPLDLRMAKNSDKQKEPLQLYCEHILQKTILPEYDFVLVDDTQDLPKEFFHVLYELSKEPKRIYWACDELPNLSSLEIPNPEELFGVDKQGRPRVSLNGDSYEGPIGKDFVLHRSYRCPLEVLMLAHAIGLGIHNPGGPVRMLENQACWEAMGYEIESGKLQKGEQVVIFRDVKNSPNPIYHLYNKQPLITVNGFQTRETELDWIANSIKKDIKEENAAPDEILLIGLDTEEAKQHLGGIQKRLVQEDIASTIPGLIEDTISFAKAGKVTLSTLKRAKGSEAYIVYILGFDSLYDDIEGISSRNRVSTAITRSKAWVRITGTGKQMEAAKDEINKVLADLPRFKFTFPNMKVLLATEDSYKSRKVLKVAQDVVNLNKNEIEALVALIAKKPETLEALSKRINETLNGH